MSCLCAFSRIESENDPVKVGIFCFVGQSKTPLNSQNRKIPRLHEQYAVAWLPALSWFKVCIASMCASASPTQHVSVKLLCTLTRPPSAGPCSPWHHNMYTQVFKTMGDFLAANPREVLVIGLSNVNCGDKEQARQQVLAALAASPLAKFFAVAVSTLMLGGWEGDCGFVVVAVVALRRRTQTGPSPVLLYVPSVSNHSTTGRLLYQCLFV